MMGDGGEFSTAGRAYLDALFGFKNYDRWRNLKNCLEFATEAAFVNWLLDAAEDKMLSRRNMCHLGLNQEKVACSQRQSLQQLQPPFAARGASSCPSGASTRDSVSLQPVTSLWSAHIKQNDGLPESTIAAAGSASNVTMQISQNTSSAAQQTCRVQPLLTTPHLPVQTKRRRLPSNDTADSTVHENSPETATNGVVRSTAAVEVESDIAVAATAVPLPAVQSPPSLNLELSPASKLREAVFLSQAHLSEHNIVHEHSDTLMDASQYVASTQQQDVVIKRQVSSDSEDEYPEIENADFSVVDHAELGLGGTLIDDKQSFSCLQCGKAFSQRPYLITHIRTHTGERPFTCNYCGKGFTQKCSMNRHIRLHTGERIYQCRLCERKFMYKLELKQHEQGVHQIQNTLDSLTPPRHENMPIA